MAETAAPADAATDEPEELTDEQKAERERRRAERAELVGKKPDSVLVPARYGFAPEQVDAIKRTIMPENSTDAELVMLLEVAGRYDLDPFAKQIFAARIQGGIQIIVSRDGLLSHAHKSPDFRGLIGDVVRRNDTFRVSMIDGERTIEHSYDLTGNGDPATQDEPGRGEILGAWAMVKREGHDPTFFFAPMEEYLRTARSGKDTPWQTHPSAMILKCAEVYALRKAFSVSGVVGEEEIERVQALEVQNLSELPEEPEWGEDELGAELRQLIDEVRGIAPGNWRPAKVRALLAGADDDARLKLRDELLGIIEDYTEANAEEADAEVVSPGS